MANIKAKKKNIKRIAKQTIRNRKVKSTLNTLKKKVNAASTPEEKALYAKQFVAALDKAAKRAIIHPNKASRHKAEVAEFVQAKAA